MGKESEPRHYSAVMTPEFTAGQRWQYNTRSGEEASRLLILKLEDVHRQQVAHIQLDGLAMKGPHGVSQIIGHTPITADALARSVTVLDAEQVALPADDSGYQTWKAASERGEAGVFTVTIAELVEAMEQAINTPTPDVFRKSNGNA